MNLSQTMSSHYGPIIISIILGFGLATLFRRACHGDGCVVVKSPDLKEIQSNTYKYGDSCYKYTPHMTPCSRGQQAP